MAFPQVDGVGTRSAVSSATYDMPYPAVVDAGELLIYIGGNDGTGDTTSISSATALTTSSAAQNHGIYAYYGTAVGDEGGDTYILDTTTSEEIAGHCLTISGWDGVTTPEIQTGSNGSSTAPDPPAITPSWGSEDTLFIAFCTWNGDAGGVSAWPSGYTDNQTQEQLSTICGSAFATKTGTATTENPGTFTLTNSVGWNSWTIAVRPSSVGGVAPQAYYYRYNL